jgi:hypothetical protein
MFPNVTKLDVHNFSLFWCLLWRLWEQHIRSSARLLLYSWKLCSSVILILEFSAKIVLCFRSDAGRTCVLCGVDVGQTLGEYMFINWWYDPRCSYIEFMSLDVLKIDGLNEISMWILIHNHKCKWRIPLAR